MCPQKYFLNAKKNKNKKKIKIKKNKAFTIFGIFW